MTLRIVVGEPANHDPQLKNTPEAQGITAPPALVVPPLEEPVVPDPVLEDPADPESVLSMPVLEKPVVPEPILEEPEAPETADALEQVLPGPAPDGSVLDSPPQAPEPLDVSAPSQATPVVEDLPAAEHLPPTEDLTPAEESVAPTPPLPRTDDLVASADDSESGSLVGVVVLTAVLSMVITASLIAAVAWRKPTVASAADARRAQLVTEEDRRLLTLEEERLTNRAAAIAADDTRVSVSWTRLGLEARALAEEHQRSLDQADSLAGRLDILIERAGQLASGDTPLPESLRGESGRLATEARAYRTILGNVATEIEAQQRVVLDHAEDAETRAHERELLGLEVRVIHDSERLADARRIVALLEGAGAKAHLFPTRLADPSQHKGQLYYRGPDEEVAARQIARLVETLELIDIEAVGRANPFLSLWVVGAAPVPVDEEDPELRDRFDP